MYKNWKAICGIEDKYFMWAISFLNIESELGRRIVESFPEYFTENKSKKVGPIPLSVIQQQAVDFGAPTGSLEDAFKKYCIPVIEFGGEKPLPQKIKRWLDAHGEWETMEWEDETLLCFYGVRDWGYFVPAKCIVAEK